MKFSVPLQEVQKGGSEMTGFASFVKKESLHILRDKWTLLIILILPIVQLLLFGFAISIEINNINFSVSAPHRTEAVRKQTEQISSNPYFTFKGYVARNQIDKELRSGKSDAVVEFSKDNSVLIAIDASNPNKGMEGAGYLQSILMSSSSNAPGTTANLAAIMPETHMLYNPQMNSAYNFVPGIMGLIFILICAMMTSVSIVREKETGTMDVLLVSPVKPIRIIFAKMVPYFVLSCINLACILLLARFVLNVPMSGNLGSVIGISLLYLALALALGLLISTVTSKQITALIISGMLLLLPIIMLSGMVFPIENMPGVLKPLTYIVPARWYISAIRKLMIEGLQFKYVLEEFFVLLVMTLFLIALALKNFKDKME